MGCGGFEEWVLENFKDGGGGMLKSVWVAAVGRSSLGIAQSRLASSELGLSKMEGMMSGGGEKKEKPRMKTEKKGRKRKILITISCKGRGYQSDQQGCAWVVFKWSGL